MSNHDYEEAGDVLKKSQGQFVKIIQIARKEYNIYLELG
jgi:hypothetical protein